MNCKRPDPEFPKLTCGYPLPCPKHTVVLVPDEEAPGLSVPLPMARILKEQTAHRLGEIGRALAKANCKPQTPD